MIPASDLDCDPDSDTEDSSFLVAKGRIAIAQKRSGIFVMSRAASG
jgi:hypothetical protein